MKPDLETIAAFLDGKLSDGARKEVVELLATNERMFEVFANAAAVEESSRSIAAADPCPQCGAKMTAAKGNTNCKRCNYPGPVTPEMVEAAAKAAAVGWGWDWNAVDDPDHVCAEFCNCIPEKPSVGDERPSREELRQGAKAGLTAAMETRHE